MKRKVVTALCSLQMFNHLEEHFASLSAGRHVGQMTVIRQPASALMTQFFTMWTTRILMMNTKWLFANSIRVSERRHWKNCGNRLLSRRPHSLDHPLYMYRQ